MAADPHDTNIEASRSSAGFRHESGAAAALRELAGMSPHDTRRLEKALVANALAQLANRDAALELSALIRTSRDIRASRLADA